MNRRPIITISLAVLLLVAVGFLYRTQSQPKASTNRRSRPAASLAPYAVIRGRVTYATTKQPAGGLYIYINNNGVKIQPDGSYTLMLSETGTLPVYFVNLGWTKQYQIADTHEQVVRLSTIEKRNYDFSIEEVIASR